jgi:hypothetical protein
MIRKMPSISFALEKNYSHQPFSFIPPEKQNKRRK